MYANGSLDIFPAINVIIFSYTCHTVFFAVWSELREDFGTSKQHTLRIAFWAILLSGTMYGSAGKYKKKINFFFPTNAVTSRTVFSFLFLYILFIIIIDKYINKYTMYTGLYNIYIKRFVRISSVSRSNQRQHCGKLSRTRPAHVCGPSRLGHHALAIHCTPRVCFAS